MIRLKGVVLRIVVSVEMRSCELLIFMVVGSRESGELLAYKG